MDELQAMLDALPGLPSDCKLLLKALLDSGCKYQAASVSADLMHLRNRHAVNRTLRKHGLPTYRRLVGWVRVLSMVLSWERYGRALSRSATDLDGDPASYSRTIKRVTGLSWSEVRSRGSAWVLMRLIEECPRTFRHASLRAM